MTTIAPTNATSASSPINYSGALTPEALMVYCSSRLSGIDQEMQSHFEKQQQYRAASSHLSSIQAKLNQLGAQPGGLQRDVGNGEADFQEIRHDFMDAIDALPAGSPERASVEKAFQDFRSSVTRNAGGDHVFDQNECQKLAQSLASVSKDISGSAELDMISLQSLMSQRQTAVQLCTNLVSALGESSKSIAQKIA